MYFWNANKLAKDLRNDEVSEYEQFKYILILSLVLAVFMSPIFNTVTKPNYFDYLDILCSLIITAWGIHLCYKKNSAGDNKNFLIRFTCLGLPVAIRAIVFFVPILIIGVALDVFFAFKQNPAISESFDYETSILNVLLIQSFTIFLYYYLSKFISKVSE